MFDIKILRAEIGRCISLLYQMLHIKKSDNPFRKDVFET